MLSLILIWCISSEFKHTAIFTPLHQDLVAVASTGEVFIIDQNNQKILKYDAKGNPVLKIDQTGETPTGFQMLVSINIFSNTLFATDMAGVHEFDLDGHWIKDHLNIKMGTLLFPSLGGFLSKGNDFDLSTKSMAEVFKWLDKDLGEIKILGKFSLGPQLTLGSKVMKMPFNPAKTPPNAKIDHLGKFMVFNGEQGLPITIYSLVPEFKELLTLKITRKPLPFNREWADRQLAEMKKHSQNINTEGIKMEWVVDYPSHFPVVQDVSVTPDNLIRVTFWSKTLDQPNYSYFNWSGAKVESKWTAEEQFRIIHIDNEMAYVTSFDKENKDYGCTSIPIKEVNKWIENNAYVDTMSDEYFPEMQEEP